MLGAATSAYQIEGAYKQDGKGLSIWDYFCEKGNTVKDGSDGKIACDHYNRYKKDVSLMSKLGLGSYRFSVSWPRVFPEGKGPVNKKGLAFYDKLVDELLENDIEPFVTLYHWDLPLALDLQGGWENRRTSEYFADYTTEVWNTIGDRVSRWITLNEALTIDVSGYVTGEHAPGKKSLFSFFRVVHNLLLAHGKATERLKDLDPEAEVGIANNLFPVVPQKTRDKRLADIINALVNKLFMDPILKNNYTFPVNMIMRLFNLRKWKSDLAAIQTPVDFIGVNHYSRIVIERTWLPFFGVRLSKLKEKLAVYTQMDWEVYPESFYDILMWLKRTYGKIPLYITENGAAFNDSFSDNGAIKDTERVGYLKAYMSSLQKAIKNGVNVKGYFVWSLLDNFEWAYGYEKKFGLVHVNRATQERTIKDSGHWYASVCEKQKGQKK